MNAKRHAKPEDDQAAQIAASSPTQTSSGPLPLGTILVSLLFCASALIIAVIAYPGAGRLYDFRAFYAAGYLLIHNPHQLFDLSIQSSVQNAIVCPMPHGVPFYHPAYEATLYAPFTFLAYRAAYFTYIVCNLLLLVTCYLFAPPAADRKLRKIPRSFFFFLAFPALICVVQGQDSILFLFLLCLIWRTLCKEHDATAGILLGLALFKLQLVLSLTFFIAVFLRGRRASRLLLGFLPTAGLLALACTALTGLSGTAQWLHRLAITAVASHFGRHAQTVAAIVPESMPSLNGLLYLLGTRFLSTHTALAVDAVIYAFIFILALLLTARARTLQVAFSVALAASLLLAPHLFLYDYLPLILLLLVLTSRALPLFAAFFYAVPIVLAAVDKLRWTALMAFLPLAILATIAYALCFSDTRAREPEKVTPHPLTAPE